MEHIIKLLLFYFKMPSKHNPSDVKIYVFGVIDSLFGNLPNTH